MNEKWIKYVNMDEKTVEMRRMYEPIILMNPQYMLYSV
jgi:hypothetical protein